jgi:hypothetical protein
MSKVSFSGSGVTSRLGGAPGSLRAVRPSGPYWIVSSGATGKVRVEEAGAWPDDPAESTQE